MAHDEHRDLLLFGHCQQPGRAFLHLADRAGRRGDVHAAHGLDGVDDHKVRFFLFDQAADLVHVIFGYQIDVLLRDLEPRSTQLDLPHRLFPRNIQNRVLVGDGTAELQQHGGFAHARLTAEQDHAAQHDAAAQHTVQFGDAGQNAAFLLGRTDLRQSLRRQRGHSLLPGRGSGFSAGKPRLGGLCDHIFVHGIPAAAAGAAAHPARAGLPAVGTDVNSLQFWFFHRRSCGARRAAGPLCLFLFILPHPADPRNRSLILPLRW